MDKKIKKLSNYNIYYSKNGLNDYVDKNVGS